jgi:CSLREA domain-containing protein
MMRTAGRLVAVVAAALVAGATTAHADTFTVNSTADAVDAAPGNGLCATASGACTLRAAVQEANAHAGPDIIMLPAGLFLLSLTGSGEDLAATGDLDVTEDLEVSGAGVEATIIDGLHSDRIFTATNNFALRDVTLRNGAESTGGGIFSGGPGTRTLERVRFEGDLASGGGGIAQLSGDLVVTDSSFAGNASGSAGGGIALVGSGALTITNTSFVSNQTFSGNGGGLLSMTTGTVSLTNVTFSHNSPTTGGGLYANGFATLTASGCTVDGNLGVTGAGGLLAAGPGNITITDTTVTGNAGPTYGGALLVGDGVQISGGEASDNVAIGSYGGLYVVGTNSLAVDGTAFRRNFGGPARAVGSSRCSAPARWRSRMPSSARTPAPTVEASSSAAAAAFRCRTFKPSTTEAVRVRAGASSSPPRPPWPSRTRRSRAT